ncbi:exo-alpha-sialidase, partial [Pseudoxanthomonas sp. SGD-10]
MMIINAIKLSFACLVAILIQQSDAHAQSQTSTTEVRIAWDYSSMQQIAERGGYPRLSRLKDSTLIAIYETRTGNIHLKKSKDNGATWSSPEEVFSKFVYSSLDGNSTV